MPPALDVSGVRGVFWVVTIEPPFTIKLKRPSRRATIEVTNSGVNSIYG